MAKQIFITEKMKIVAQTGYLYCSLSIHNKGEIMKYIIILKLSKNN